MAEQTIVLDPIEAALAALAGGRVVIVVDDEDRENEGDFVLAAERATPATVGFVVRHSSGMVCVPMAGEDLDRLQVPMMTTDNADPRRTAYTVTVDAAAGVSTGISAADRAHTARVLANRRSRPDDLTRPGHVLPLRARPDGVLARPGHTEAAVDLTRLAGLRPVGVIAEVVRDDGDLMRAPELRRFADEHGLVMISIAQLVAYRRRRDLRIRRLTQTVLPTVHGTFAVSAYASEPGGEEHLALVLGEVAGRERVLVRAHSECLTGDVLGSLRCDCGRQVQESFQRIAAAGSGVLIYLRGHEGRGIGLTAKLAAYALQDRGRDTVEANLELGLPVDARDYGVVGPILRDLGVRSVRLLTNNPGKIAALVEDGVDVVERVPLVVPSGPSNRRYLRTKRDRLGHALPADGCSGDSAAVGAVPVPAAGTVVG